MSVNFYRQILASQAPLSLFKLGIFALLQVIVLALLKLPLVRRV
jgi:hypothetical protein